MTDDQQLSLLTGEYYGRNPTTTEMISGAIIELDNRGPLKQGGRGHQILMTYAHGLRQTAYTAGVNATGDHHHGRRESRRLFDRGFLVKDGTLPNPAPGGRPHVDAYRITQVGRDELKRLAGARR